MHPSNNLSIWGRLTADPSFPAKEGQTPRLTFSIAYNQKNGDPIFLDCVAWGGLAEAFKDKLFKGKPVAVNGSLRLNKWTDDKGEHQKFIVDVDGLGLFPVDQTMKAGDQQSDPEGNGQ